MLYRRTGQYTFDDGKPIRLDCGSDLCGNDHGDILGSPMGAGYGTLYRLKCACISGSKSVPSGRESRPRLVLRHVFRPHHGEWLAGLCTEEYEGSDYPDASFLGLLVVPNPETAEESAHAIELPLSFVQAVVDGVAPKPPPLRQRGYPDCCCGE
ncbi:MAG: hypothetical protein ACRYFU_26085 [Janthinobacterium lividum]